ncbi:SPOR domain-containing protein [Serratia symbiotica]|uniref:SPOR domain-containing protein n=1 Tax=Serratia symbiotica TaxID=138074 RepID=UPI001328730C|nr:SPOR domain-containing protein [Serratia symbiotica]MBF1994920.1 SPOR domain-containing protein [Serratia symbiotica]MBQ0954969.1 SPOR domain-containing protein [Serratia symbiotica]QTP14376.1 SPOR domain-containing protein [Serratia symbiotica]
MDEFKPEDDLRPDSRDRRPMHSRKPAVVSRFAVSRQHLMIGIGVLVLLLLVVGMGSALKAPTKHETAQEGTQNGVVKDINLSGSSALVTSNNGVVGGTTDTHGNVGVSTTSQPQNVSVPPIASTPTQAQPLPPQGGARQRIELPGNMVDALSSQQGQVDTVTQGKIGVQSTLPTASATVMNSAAAREAMHPLQGSAPQAKTASKSATTHHKAPTTVSASTLASSAKAGTVSGSALQSAVGNHYTLQLSSASRPDTLHAYAKQQKLQNYLVYPTQRNGKPWYVLVSGNYASSEEAKRAIVTLPADVQVKKPWVRSARQVQQELKK